MDSATLDDASITKPVNDNDFHRACPGGITTDQLLGLSLFLRFPASAARRESGVRLMPEKGDANEGS
jgi:hypothetical protein